MMQSHAASALVLLSHSLRSTIKDRKRPSGTRKIQKTSQITPGPRLSRQIIRRVQDSNRVPAIHEAFQSNASFAELILREQSCEDGGDVERHVLQVISVARFRPLECGEFGRCESLAQRFVEGRALWIAVVVTVHIAFGSFGDCPAMWENGKDVVEWDGEEGDVEIWGHCCERLVVDFLFVVRFSSVSDKMLNCCLSR